MPSRMSGHFTTTFLWMLRQFAAFLDHGAGLGGDHFRADIAIDDLADPADLFRDRLPFLARSRWDWS